MSCVVRDGVFDAWSWCASDVLVWRRPPRPLDATRAIDGTNPPGLLFVAAGDASFLPCELARLHAPGWGFDDELVLAPYAIDDATDGLYARRVRPRDVFFLAADSLAALVWGLHDWVHFHNHGPFDDPATTELQCDLVALAWLRANRDAIGAWIEVRCGDGKVMRREITVGGGHASGELGWRHFGLGDAD